MSSKRTRHMMYAQQLEHLPSKNISELKNIIEAEVKPSKYAFIVHDKDIDDAGRNEAAHIHLMMSFTNARSIASVAKLLSDKPQYLQAWNGNAENGYCYLIHATDSARAKHRYSAEEVIANFDYSTMLDKTIRQVGVSKTKVKVQEIMDALYEGRITLRQAEDELTGSQYAKVSHQLETVYVKYLQKEAELWRTQMIESRQRTTTLWVYGASSTGKTSLARAIAQKRGADYFVTGSSRDAFQGYEGQHTLIVEELRPKNIRYNDLLRITDPFALETGGVMAPSRFRDKPLMVGLIIVTTPYDPYRYYCEEMDGLLNKDTRDSFKQLERRIALTLEMTMEEICAAEYVDERTGYRQMHGMSQPNSYSSEGRGSQKTSSISALFNQLIDGYVQLPIDGLGA